MGQNLSVSDFTAAKIDKLPGCFQCAAEPEGWTSLISCAIHCSSQPVDVSYGFVYDAQLGLCTGKQATVSVAHKPLIFVEHTPATGELSRLCVPAGVGGIRVVGVR